MKVLIADKSKQIVRRLEEMLLGTVNGITVSSTSSYENWQQRLHEQQPDIVLLGISLPENECLQLIGGIKKATQKITVIVLSTNVNPFFYGQCRALGADYFLDKYYEFEKIPDLINDISVPGKKIS